MKNELIVAAGAIPVTMFVLANIGGNTKNMTGDDAAVRKTLGVTATSMVIAAAATGSIPAALTTSLAIGAVFWAMRDVWQLPAAQEFVP